MILGNKHPPLLRKSFGWRAPMFRGELPTVSQSFHSDP